MFRGVYGCIEVYRGVYECLEVYRSAEDRCGRVNEGSRVAVWSSTGADKASTLIHSYKHDTSLISHHCNRQQLAVMGDFTDDVFLVLILY